MPNQISIYQMRCRECEHHDECMPCSQRDYERCLIEGYNNPLNAWESKGD